MNNLVRSWRRGNKTVATGISEVSHVCITQRLQRRGCPPEEQWRIGHLCAVDRKAARWRKTAKYLIVIEATVLYYSSSRGQNENPSILYAVFLR